jgi:hypothetical protein
MTLGADRPAGTRPAGKAPGTDKRSEAFGWRSCRDGTRRGLSIAGRTQRPTVLSCRGDSRTRRLRDGWFASVVNWAWERGFVWPQIRTGTLLYAVVLVAADYFTAPDRQVLTARLPVHGVQTIYSRIGDVFAWLCPARLVLLLAAARPRRTGPQTRSDRCPKRVRDHRTPVVVRARAASRAAARIHAQVTRSRRIEVSLIGASHREAVASVEAVP